MRRLLNAFGAWLFVKTGGDDAALGRLAMSLVTPEPMSQDPSDRRKMAGSLAQVHANEEMRAMMSQLMHEQREFLANKATAEGLYQVRATMNGIALVRDRLASFAAEHEAELLKREYFDKHKPI